MYNKGIQNGQVRVLMFGLHHSARSTGIQSAQSDDAIPDINQAFSTKDIEFLTTCSKVLYLSVDEA